MKNFPMYNPIIATLFLLITFLLGGCPTEVKYVTEYINVTEYTTEDCELEHVEPACQGECIPLTNASKVEIAELSDEACEWMGCAGTHKLGNIRIYDDAMCDNWAERGGNVHDYNSVLDIINQGTYDNKIRVLDAMNKLRNFNLCTNEQDCKVGEAAARARIEQYHPGFFEATGRVLNDTQNTYGF